MVALDAHPTTASAPASAPAPARTPLPITDSRAAAAAAQAGREAGFEWLYTHYQNAIYNFIYRTMGSAEDARDLTQDVFVKAWLNIHKTSDDLKVGPWLYRIATNACLDRLRHNKLVKWTPWQAFIGVFHPSQVAGAKDSPHQQAAVAEDAREIQMVLSRMHPKYRMVLVLREFHDLQYDQIAEVLGTTRAAVKSVLFRARGEFRAVCARMTAAGEITIGTLGATQDPVPTIAAAAYARPVATLALR